VLRLLARKEDSSRGLRQRSPRRTLSPKMLPLEARGTLRRVRSLLVPGPGILTWFPFDTREATCGAGEGLPPRRPRRKPSKLSNRFLLSLRSGSLASHRGSRQTFLHFRLQGLHLNSCYFHQDRHSGLFQAGSRRTPFTTSSVKALTPPYSLTPPTCAPVAADKPPAPAPSIFRANSFGR
jgi:hypothetical protein